MGDVHRIPRCADKSYSDPEFMRLLSIDPARLPHRLSPFHTRPVYQYTKGEVGGINHDIPNVSRTNNVSDV